MFDRMHNRFTIIGNLKAISAMRVGTEVSAAPVGTEHPVLKDTNGKPFIPGASLKGVLRSYLEAWMRGMVAPEAWDHIACDLSASDDHWCISNARMRRIRQDTHLDINTAVQKESCLLCLTFGSPWLASHIYIPDVPVNDDLWAGQFEVRDGVAIDRDKGTAANGKLYDYEVVPTGTIFDLEMTAINLADWQKGLLWLGLRALNQETIALGGLSGRGLGWIKLTNCKVHVLERGQIFTALTGEAAGEMFNDLEDARARDWVGALHARIKTVVATAKEVHYA